MHICRHREIYFQELAHMIIEAWRVQNLMWQAGDLGKVSVRVHRKSAGRISPLGVVSLCSFKVPTDRMRPTHIMEGNLLHSKSTNLNVNLK